MLVGIQRITPVIGVLFMQGVTADGEPMLLITAENPDRINGFSTTVAKDALERFHLDTFHADYVLHFGNRSSSG